MRHLLFAGVVVAAMAPLAFAKADRNDALLSVVTPQPRGEAPAHPFVNVIVRFGTTPAGAVADPATFTAKLGSQNITSQFADEVENGKVIGKRAALTDAVLRIGRRLRLRLGVHSVPKDLGKGKPRVFRDLDLIKFRAVEQANQPPVAHVSASSDVALDGIPIQFDGSQSQDADLDALTYLWTFGDGSTSSERKPSHTYGEVTGDELVTLVVSDGQASSAPVTITLSAAPTCDEGALPGTLKVEADGALEFGAVALGGSTSRTITIRNTDAGEGTQVKASLGSDSTEFSIDPLAVTLGPGESMPVTITYHPTTAGHQAARLGLVACSAGGNSLAFLAHGFGGAAPGTGPTLSPDTLFYTGLAPGVSRFGIFGILPDGTRFPVDNSAHWCLKPNNTGTRDYCFVNADCKADGESCVDPAPLTVNFDPSDLCSDGRGNLFILSEDTVYDPVGDDNEVTGSLVRIQLDATGHRVGEDVLRRVTGQSTQIACDRKAPANDGLVYMAQYNAILDMPNCLRDAKESLVGFRKGNGAVADVGNLDRIDSTEVPPLALCDDDYDPVQDLAVAGDGSAVFSLPENGGIYRIRPNPLYIIQPTRELFRTDHVVAHPDGAILYATATDAGTTGTIRLYKVFPEQAEAGPLKLDDLTPCGTFSVPNNRPVNETHTFTIVSTLAVGAAGSGDDAIVLVNFATVGGSGSITSNLRPQGTVAFSSPAGSTSCDAATLENLELLDSMSF